MGAVLTYCATPISRLARTVEILLGLARLIAQKIDLLLALEFSDLFLLAEGIRLALNTVDLQFPLHPFEVLVVS